MTTLKEFLERKAKARQGGIQGNTHSLFPDDAVADSTPSEGNNTEAQKIVGNKVAYWREKFNTIQWE